MNIKYILLAAALFVLAVIWLEVKYHSDKDL